MQKDLRGQEGTPVSAHFQHTTHYPLVGNVIELFSSHRFIIFGASTGEV